MSFFSAKAEYITAGEGLFSRAAHILKTEVRGLSVLLVYDTEDAPEGLVRALTREGYPVTSKSARDVAAEDVTRGAVLLSFGGREAQAAAFRVAGGVPVCVYLTSFAECLTPPPQNTGKPWFYFADTREFGDRETPAYREALVCALCIGATLDPTVFDCALPVLDEAGVAKRCVRVLCDLAEAGDKPVTKCLRFGERMRGVVEKLDTTLAKDEARALGMLFEGRIGVAVGVTRESAFRALEDILTYYGYPRRVSFSREEFLAACGDGEVTLLLPRVPGDCEERAFSPSELYDILKTREG